MKSYRVSIQIKAVEYYFGLGCADFMCYKVMLVFASVEIIPQCDYESKRSNLLWGALFSRGTR